VSTPLPTLARTEPTWKAHRDRTLLALVFFCGAPLALGSFFFAIHGGGSERTDFFVAMAWFVILGLSFLEVRGLKGAEWCSAPVIVTLRALLEFALVPAWAVLIGDERVDALSSTAMLLVLLAFAMFWAGSWAVMRRTALRFQPRWPGSTPERLATASMVCLCVGGLAKFMQWRAGLNSYMSDEFSRTAAIEKVQWLYTIGNLLTACLIISGIEYLGKRSSNYAIRIAFWSSLTLSLFFGAISGMKEELLIPLVLLAVVYGITRARFPRSALVLPVLLVLMYPFVIAYRSNLNSGYREQANTVSGLSDLVHKTVNDVVTTRSSNNDPLQTGLDSTQERLSLLNSVRDIVGLPSPSLLNGDEKLWMSPFYPFVPRVLWKSKPILVKGQRFSIAMGRPRTTSTALTPVGDLYTLGGWMGVAVGMLLYGAGLQLIFNAISKEMTEKRLFIYLSLLMPMVNLELDVFASCRNWYTAAIF
jgi:hypothetical protein